MKKMTTPERLAMTVTDTTYVYDTDVKAPFMRNDGGEWCPMCSTMYFTLTDCHGAVHMFYVDNGALTKVVV
jgi:hypothetical protein